MNTRKKIKAIFSMSNNKTYEDSGWGGVYDIFKTLSNSGVEVIVNALIGDHSTQTWHITMFSNGQKFTGSIDTHAAGSLIDPFGRYTILAQLNL